MNRCLEQLIRPARPLLRVVAEAACILIPPKRGAALVYSAVASEANAVETVRWLSAKGSGRVTWLVDDSSDRDRLYRLLGSQAATRHVSIRSVRDLRWPIWLARSEFFFFTHPLLGGLSPIDRRRVYTNLWHGDGPKSNSAPPARRRIADFTVAGTRLWGQHKAAVLNAGEPLVYGNPRIDQFRRPATDEQLISIGIDPSEHIVLWAPTYRTGRTTFGEPISHTAVGDSPFEDLLAARTSLLTTCRESKIRLVVKSHPLDAGTFDRLGLTTIADDALLDAGIGLYQLLGRVAAIVSDYSSIWTDYLVLDRPIALYCPDIDSYLSGVFAREGALAPAPSPLLKSVDELFTFIRRVGDGADPYAAWRSRACHELGAVLELGATERVMTRVVTNR